MLPKCALPGAPPGRRCVTGLVRGLRPDGLHPRLISVAPPGQSELPTTCLCDDSLAPEVRASRAHTMFSRRKRRLARAGALLQRFDRKGRVVFGGVDEFVVFADQ